IDQLPWVQGVSGLLGFTATFLFLASLRRVARHFQRADLVSAANATLGLLGGAAASVVLVVLPVLVTAGARNAAGVEFVFALGLLRGLQAALSAPQAASPPA